MAMTRAGGVSVTSTYKKPKAPTIDLAGGTIAPPGGLPDKYRGPGGIIAMQYPNKIMWRPYDPFSGGQYGTPNVPPPVNNPPPGGTGGGSGWLGMPSYSGFTPTLPPGGSGSGGGYYDTNPVNLMSVGRGITAGGGGRPAGSNPLNTNYRPTGMMLLQDTYRAYMRDLQDAGTAEDQIPSFEQWMEARYNALGAMGGASNINYRNVGEYYKNLGREIERIMNPRERPPEDQVGIQQSTPGGWSPPVNQRY